jgi:DNA-binding PadR family transcriptional regulator
MDKPALFEDTDALAWLILGYLHGHPDAKDTVDGVEKWWLNGREITIDPRTVQGSLDQLVKSGWLVSYQRQGTGIVYGLNRTRRDRLRQFLRRGEDRH